MVFKEILEGCRKRDRQSQKELYKMYYSYGMSITMRYADSRDQAAAMLNDAFMKVFNNLKKFDDQRPFKPWLRRIIINTAINHFYSNGRQGEHVQLSEVVNEVNTREKIISGINYKEIIAMIQELSPAYRTVFNLYVIEGFKHREIAEILGISVGTSKSNLSKAKQNLQAILEKNLT